MMEVLSPWSRRIIAAGLLLLAVSSIANLIIAPLVEWTQMSLDDLESARQREQRIAMAANAEPPTSGDPIPPELIIIAPNQAAAFDQAAATVSAMAVKNQVVVEGISPTPSGIGKKVAFDIKASGSEISLVRMLSELEASFPTLRFESWTILAPDAPDAPAKLLARGITVWSPPR